MASRPDDSTWRTIGLAVSIPTMMGACVVVSLLIGSFLDRKLGTGSWMTGIFLVLGIAAGFRETVVLIKRVSKSDR